MIADLFAYKAWADSELLAALRGLPAVTPGETLTPMIRMFNHIHVVDKIFQAHLQRRTHGYTVANTEETPMLDALSFDIAETDAWYCTLSRDATADQLAEVISFQFTDGDAGQMQCEEIMHHVLAHGAYHRGNIGQMLKAIGVAPPRDLFTKFLHAREPARRAG